VTAPPSHHLVGVWNPSYGADAMDAHVELLLRHARAYRAGTRHEDDVHVWWGKLRSPHRQSPLPHLPEILALDDELASDDGEPRELHLYLTDYRSLYVAHLGGVTADDVRDDPDAAEHVPAYYRRVDMPADCWFQLWDIRRVVLDDTPAVIAELGRLRNTRYHDQRVSLYGGMVELPLLVTRPDGARWFDERTRARLIGDRHWVEFDAERAGTGEMQRDLRENRFGAALWGNLDPAARGFIATAEQLFRTHRTDAAFDLSAVVVDFAKAVEVQVNARLREALAGADARLRRANVDGATVDLVEDGPFALGALAHAIRGEEARNGWLRRRLVHGDWFAASLPPILDELREVRNAAAHGEPVDRERVAQLRNRLVGVGSKGTLLDLAQVRLA